MKIALIIEHFDATRGGAEHFTVWLATELAARGHEVHVVCHDVAARVNRYRQATQRASHDADRSHQAHPAEELPHDGIHIHRLRGMKLNSGFGFRLFGSRAAHWCRENHPDVSHSMTVAFAADIYHPQAGVYAAMQTQAISSRNTKAAATWKQFMLHLSGKQRALLALEKHALKTRAKGGPKRIISLCSMITAQLQHHYAVDSRSIFQLPYARMTPVRPIDPEQSQEARAWFRGLYRLAENDKVAVFVGHDFRRKGLRFAIEAIAKTKDWKLLVVGLGKAREYLELADALHLNDAPPGASAAPRVLFVGPTREMEKVYAAADALLLPTFYDSFGLVVLEAFSHGLPAISTAFLGAAYLVTESRAGAIVASPREVESMARALESLPPAASPDGLALAARARHASIGMLPKEYFDKLLALYEEVRTEK